MQSHCYCLFVLDCVTDWQFAGGFGATPVLARRLIETDRSIVHHLLQRKLAALQLLVAL